MSFFNNTYAFYNVRAVLVQQLMDTVYKYPMGVYYTYGPVHP